MEPQSELVRASFELSTANSDGNGAIDIESDSLEIESGELGLAGQLRVAARLGGGELASRSFGLAGSTVEVSGVTVRREGEVVGEEWRGQLRFEGGRLRIGAPLSGDAEVSLELTDARPLLVYFAEHRPTRVW